MNIVRYIDQFIGFNSIKISWSKRQKKQLSTRNDVEQSLHLPKATNKTTTTWLYNILYYSGLKHYQVPTLSIVQW